MAFMAWIPSYKNLTLWARSELLGSAAKLTLDTLVTLC